MAHLTKAEGTVADEALANGWLTISENLRRMQDLITKLAMGRLN